MCVQFNLSGLLEQPAVSKVISSICACAYVQLIVPTHVCLCVFVFVCLCMCVWCVCVRVLLMKLPCARQGDVSVFSL